ncbi:MAG: Tm-1-like ATP-binding domain-containing protein, partial [Lachnospiraceae bacterium]|nr:Tm-1-like ATP-binding domain-containing protein [Candidatus Equihabitans merdae]
MRTVAITGTFDSKGEEYFFLKKTFEEMGIQTLTIHTGVFAPYFEPDIDNGEVFAAGGVDGDAIVAGNDRAAATKALSEGLAAMLPKLYAEGKFDGVISLGGSGGTSIASAGTRALPIGMPKILVSTMASGDTRRFVGSSDIIMMPSVLDVAGLNS